MNSLAVADLWGRRRCIAWSSPNPSMPSVRRRPAGAIQSCSPN